MINFNNVKIFSGSSNVELASKIAEKIGFPRKGRNSKI